MSGLAGFVSGLEMKRLYLGIVIFVICAVGAAALAEDWRELKGEHFLIYYIQDRGFAKKVLSRAEKYYDKIASDLGYSRYDNFWSWENRVKIYIYGSQEDFLSASGIELEWPMGMADYKKKEIRSFRWSEGFLDSLLPHEMTHLIFRDFVGFTGEIPLWLDEGVAQWEEKGRKKEAKRIVRGLIGDGKYIPLSALMSMDIRKEPDAEVSYKFYAQSVSLVAFFCEKYGSSKFRLFCRQLRDGKTMDEALSHIYVNSINDTEELEKKWLEYYGGG